MTQKLRHIPQHLVLNNILPRLPSKSLLRFKCVSKLWLSTISYPSFTNGESIFAMIRHGPGQAICFYSIDDQASFEALPKIWRLSEDDFEYKTLVTNSCNGLVLIGYDESLYLFNPSTRYSKKVLTLDDLSLEYYVTAGLCYDPSIDDYKAVLCLQHNTPDYGGIFVITASLKRKRWTEVSFPFELQHSVKGGPVINERLHWIACNKGTDRFSSARIIVWFDPLNNTFHELPTPKPNYREDNAIIGLGVLDGCLCMSRVNNQTDFESNIEILTMKEYGVLESWTSIFVISNLNLNPYYQELTPLIVTRKGEILFRMDTKEILAYNPTKESYRKVPNTGADDPYSIVRATALVQNLVSPVGYCWDAKRHQKCGNEITWITTKGALAFLSSEH